MTSKVCPTCAGTGWAFVESLKKEMPCVRCAEDTEIERAYKAKIYTLRMALAGAIAKERGWSEKANQALKDTETGPSEK